MNEFPGFPRGGGFVVEAHHGGHPLEWTIFALLLLSLLLTAATLALALARQRRLGVAVASGSALPPPQAPPDAILAGRYARGEIGRDEFLRALDDLRSSQPPGDEAPTVEQPPG